MESKIHGTRPAAVSLLDRLIPLDVVLPIDLAPNGDRDLLICLCIPHGDLHRVVVRRDGSQHLRCLHVIECGHKSRRMTRHTHGVGISGAGVGMDLVVAGGMMLRQVNIAGPSPIRLYRIVPGQIILSVLHAPNCELDLGMAVAGHIGHLDSQDVVVLYRRHSVILLGPANDILRAAAVVALSDLRLRANAVVRAGRVVGELVGHVLDYIDPIARDDARAVIGVNLISSQIFVVAHGHCDDPLAVVLLYTAEPLHVILTVVLAPHGDPAVCERLALHRCEDDRQYAAVLSQIQSDRTPHPAFLIEVIAGAIDTLPAGHHSTVVGRVLIGVEVIGVITNIRHAESHLAVVIVVGIAVGLLDKAGMSANDQTVVKHERHLIDHLLAVIGHAVFIEAIVVLFHQEPAGLCHTAQEIHLASSGLIASPAGIVPFDGVNRRMAVAADQLAVAADSVLQSMALIRAAAGQGFQGHVVQKLLAAIGLHVVDVDLHLGAVGLHAQIDRVEVRGGLCKDLLVIKDVLAVDRIGLLTAGAADVVIHTVLRVDLAALQGIGTGEGVVMSGKHHINAGFLRSRRDILRHGAVAALGVGVIGRLVDGQDLPGSVAGLRILYQPLRRRLHVAADAAVVDDRHIDIAVGGGPAAAHAVFRQGEYAADNVGVAVTLKLMVAQNMDHVGAAQLLGVQQLHHLVQLGKVGGAVHDVAGLDAEVIAAGFQGVKDVADIGRVLGLNIAQHEELLGRISRAGGKALRRLRPVLLAGRGLILVGRTGRQTAQRDAVHVHRLVAAAGKGAQLRVCRNGGAPVLRALNTPAQELLLRCRRVGQPRDILCCTAIFRGVKEECGLHIRHRIVGIDSAAHGQASVLSLGVDGYHAGGSERIAGQGAVLTGLTQGGAVFPEDLRVGYRLTLQIGHRQHGVPTGQHRITGHADGRAHRQRYSGGGEGRQIAVHVIAHAGSDLVEECAAGCQVVRHLHLHCGDQVAVLYRAAAGTHSLNGYGVILCVVAIRGVIALRGLEILGECHGAVGILPIQADDRVALADGAVGAPDLQRYISAHGGHGLHVGHTDEILRTAALHGEVAGLGGLVTEAVAERHRNGVRPVGKLHTVQVDVAVAGYQYGLLRHIGAVHIEAHGVGIHAGGILAGGIAEIGAQVEGASADRAAVHQLLIVEGDGVHLRIVDIIRIRAVHELKIVQIDGSDPRLDHFDTVDEHQAEGHALHQAKGSIRRLQLGLAVLPALPVDTGLLAIRRMGRLDNGLRLEGIVELHLVSILIKSIGSQPQAGVRPLALPLDAHALRGIDPHAKARGNARNRHIVGSTDARALCHFTAVAEVEVQLHCFGTKAYGLAVVDADDLNGLVAAAVVVKGIQNTVFPAVILLRGDSAAVLIDVILKVPHDGRQHTDHSLDGAGHRLVKGRGGGDVGGHTVTVRRAERVAGEGTHLRVSQRPLDIAVLVVHVSVLIAYHQTQIGFLVKVQTDLIGVKGDRVRLHQLHRGGADHVVALAQHDGDNANAVSTGRKQTGGRVDRAKRCGFLRQLPHQTLRQRRCAAAAVYAHSAELHGGAGRIQLIAGGDQCVVKYAVLRNGGNADETGADGPLLTVGGLAEHLQLAALFAGREGRGAAAIEVQSRHAAGVLQHSCHLIEVHADGAGRQTALRHEEHDAAVSPDTHTVSGVHRSVAGHLDLTVPQKVERAGDGFHYIVRRGSGVTDDRGAVRQDRKIRLVGGLDHVALHDQVTRGLAGAHVEVVAVGGHDDRACRIGDLAVVRGQPRGLLQAPLTLADRLSIPDTIRRRASSRVVAVVGGLERYVLGQVDLRHVTNGLMIVLVTHDDLVVGHTIGNGVVRLYDRRQARCGSCAVQRDGALHGGLRGERRQDIHLVLAVVPLSSRLCLVGILGNVRFFPCAFRSCDVLVAPVTGFFLSVRVNQGNFCVFCLSCAVLDRKCQGNGVQQE